MFRKEAVCLGLMLALGVAACGGGGGRGGNAQVPPQSDTPRPVPVSYSVDLVPRQVVGGSAATGTARATLTVDADSSLTGEVAFSGFLAEKVTINAGYAGARGDVLITLDRGNDGFWALPTGSTLTDWDLDRLDAGALYVVATAAAPEEMIRGQILPPRVTVDLVPLIGAQTVGAHTPLYSTAAYAAVTYETASRTVTVHANGAALESASRVHLHRGLAGSNGLVFEYLTQDSADASHWYLPPGVLSQPTAALEGGELYIDVHSTEHPEGALRGQIVRDEGVRFIPLTSGDVVPPAGNELWGMAATSDYDWHWDDVEFEIHVNLRHPRSAVNAVTVNGGRTGENGPELVSLSPRSSQPGAWYADVLVLAEEGDKGLYINVATLASPLGGARGQYDSPPVDASGGGRFSVTSIHPNDGATVLALPDEIRVTFNDDVDTADDGSIDLATVTLTASGGDASFGDGNELSVTPLAAFATGRTLIIQLDGATAEDDVYRLTIDGVRSAESRILLNIESIFRVDRTRPPAPTLGDVQAAVLTPNCALGGCHTGATAPFGLDLSDGATFGSTVGIPSVLAPGKDRVRPFEPDVSYLLGGYDSWPHARSLPLLTNTARQMLREWIQHGALDN